jgi:DNA polymerase
MSATDNNMGDRIDPAIAAQLLGWWIDSGVDVAVGEEARDWRRSAAPVQTKASAVPVPLPVEATADMPGDLAAFQAWLGSATGLPLDRGGLRRVLPMGGESAPVMLLADFPSAQECAEGLPIAGDAWGLAVKMLAAIGIDASSAYLGNLACFHSPGVKVDAAEFDRCAALARDHVRLARPKRLILLGDAAARALTGQPLQAARGRIHRVEGVRTIATFHPRWLLQRPSDKALAWKDLLLLMSEEG